MKKSHTAQELADFVGAKLHGDATLHITNVASLDLAGPSDASFLANPLYNEMMKKSQAGIVCVDKSAEIIKGKTYLITEDPSLAFQKIAEFFLKDKNPTHTGFEAIHPSAVIHPSAQIGTDVNIGPHVVIARDVIIGKGASILGSSFISQGVQIGNDCVIFPGVTIREECILGNRVTLQPGAVIGSCGFGFATDKKNNTHKKLDHLGNVILEDDVEIGANTTIDRARFKTTLIKKGTKIDNLVQLGHNVEVGENVIIVSQSGIAGSSTVGNNVVIGGQVGVAGHLKITNNVQIASQSGISKNLTTPGPYRGSPAIPMDQYNRRAVLVRRLEKLYARVENLENLILKD
ncbi:UDP-3-O-(3-hydroxymyristoyl)glucosamine N-acyltransferase [Candidatus Aerophobetes bacterium]|uniref:UDP-3-O-acylglucosamine N-acyltransferase n=1 Tax=Aerophobetes bacterium TaxID=2030807 RepID=A0A2A4X7X5_UNCAE|nr:MAG: UDP-3-O-(3-hydroxymyristoyl)glucosamine N-acyltransferase [Candidatus Aerophobetes bacterium]